jgi:hypothetical protein
VCRREPFVGFDARAFLFSFGPRKKAVILEMKEGEGSHSHVIRFVGLHLTSNHQPDAPAKRVRQLTSLQHALFSGQTPPLNLSTVFLGDFNLFSDDVITTRAIPSHFVDCWDALHPGEEGVTFDPIRNPLAEVNSHYGIPGRLDRIYLSSSHYQAKFASVFGNDPIVFTEKSDTTTKYARDWWPSGATLMLFALLL